MKTPTLPKAALSAFAIACLSALTAHAVSFDANVTPDVIFGSGNANGSWTVDTANDIELGLRAKLRHNGSGAPENTFNSNGDGTYSFAAGVAPTQASPTAVWSFEWSINSSVTGPFRGLDDFTYVLGIDSDASLGTSFSVFDPINAPHPVTVFWDHSFGHNGTGNGGGIESANLAEYATNIAQFNVAQNSWKAHWYMPPGAFDPTVDGTYDFYLEAYDGSTQLARTSIQVIVGNGGASVPDGGSVSLMVLAGLAGLAFLRRR